VDQNSLKLDHYKLPGRAGALQATGDTQAVLAELGDDYDAYHDQVAEAMERCGGRPDPRDFRDDFEGYAAAVDHFVDLVRAEQFMRIAHAWRKEGMQLGKTRSGGVPLVDERHRLVHRSGDGSKRASRRGDSKLDRWSPPTPPRIVDLGD
jgi:hypothetical protein